MEIYYKKRTKIYLWLAYGFLSLSGLGMIILEESQGSDWIQSQNGIMVTIGFFIGYALIVLGCGYWSEGKGYSKTRGILMGLFLHVFAPIVLAFHSDRGLLKKVEKECASCHKRVFPFPVPGGPWTGTLGELASLPKIEPHHAYLCENCQAVICPVCLGKKASQLGVRMFVCTQCGHRPLKTIYR